MSSSSNHGTIFAPVAVRSPWFAVFLIVIAAAALLGPAFILYDAYGFSTFAYRVSPDGLHVRYGFINLWIPADEIEAVTFVADPGPLRRVEGVGLPEVQRGWWTTEDGRRLYRLTTVRHDVVWVDTADDATTARPGTRYMFSPEQPQRFVELLEAVRRGQAEERGLGPEGVVFAPAVGSAGHPAANPLNIFLAVETLIMGALPILLWHGRRSLRYRVIDEGIMIRHLFGEHRLKWDGVKNIRLLQAPLRGVRVIGASLPGYYVGSFSLRGLGSARVYATDLRRGPLVLVEHRPAGNVVLSPADVDGFMAAVSRYRR